MNFGFSSGEKLHNTKSHNVLSRDCEMWLLGAQDAQRLSVLDNGHLTNTIQVLQAHRMSDDEAYRHAFGADSNLLSLCPASDGLKTFCIYRHIIY